MSVKDLFNKGDGRIISSKTLEDILDDGMESASYVSEFEKDSERFMPTVDFTKPAKFARYGSAESYYADTINNIWKTFPYDGSLKEKISWHNTGSYLQRFIFEKEYPRTNGYATFNSASHTYTSTADGITFSSSAPQYILFSGGPHADPSGNYKSQLLPGYSGKGKSKANIYDTDTLRTNNLEFAPDRGVTVEFWMKKNGWASTGANKAEYFFDLASSGAIGNNYGHVSIYSFYGAKSQLRSWINSGSVNSALYHETGLADIADGKWHHYATTYFSDGESKVTSNLYVDGVKTSTLKGNYIGSITGSMVAALGAMSHPLDENLANPATALTYGDAGWGNAAFTSIDEFRYWKKIRSAKEIRRFWKFQVGGGTNTDTSNTHLGVYYKFNEGITGNSAKDSVVLDYSGRISNGTWYGYQSDSRSTGSAMVESGQTTSEYKDPIVYSTHPDVKSYYDRKVLEGKNWDHNNNASLYYTLPTWLIESDLESSMGGSEVLKKLTQIMASHFDTLQLQIDHLPKLKNIGYPSSSLGPTFSDKPNPFMDKLLHSYGFETAELFSDITALERYYNRNESASFGLKINEIKNFVYQNIYNNLTTIYKSKGTERSLRNTLRCFGIDDELIKINLYADNATFQYEDNYRTLSVDNKYVDFNDYIYKQPLSQIFNNATVYQSADSINERSVGYISGTNIFKGEYLKGFSFSAEAEVVFPKKVEANKDLGASPLLMTSSIFGMHQVDRNSANVIKWIDGNTTTNDHSHFKVYAVRDRKNSDDVRFALDLSGSITLSSEFYPEVYENSKWNFAVSVSPEKKYNDLVSGSFDPADASTGYKLGFYGINRELGHIINEFYLTKSLSFDGGRKFVSAPKRMYAGSHRTDFTGSLLLSSDVKIGSVRAWLDHLTTASVKAHALDPKNFGRSHDYGNSYFSQTQLSGAHIRPIETLILNWDFENITSSSGNGAFYVADFSSGSDNYLGRYPKLFGDIVDRQHDAKGAFFVANSNKVVDKVYVPAAKKQLPELINSDNMINIVEQDDDVFTRESRPIQYYIALEKSMYQTISEEMINFFETIQYFDNVIGDPVNKYRQDYKEMGKLRQLFFEKVQNVPDIEKYLSYYKWFDSAIIKMIQNLLPASANASDSLRNMIESHVLERNKYWNKFPTLEMNQPPPQAKIMGINELAYNWKFGHGPSPLRFEDSFGSALDLNKWVRSSADIKTVQGGGNWAVVLKGLSPSGEPLATGARRWLRTKNKYSGPLKISYSILRGASVAYDLDAPDGFTERLNLQYSKDGTTWTKITDHEVGTLSAGTWQAHQITYNATQPVYLRWAQIFHSNPDSDDFDHWAVDDIKIDYYTNQNKNCLWWSERALRSDPVLTSGDAAIDAQRDALRLIVTTENSASGPRRKDAAGTVYNGSAYALRRLSRPYKFDIERSKHLDGGSNKDGNNAFGFHRQAIRWKDPNSYITFEKNSDQPPVCEDNNQLGIKRRIIGTAEVYRDGVPIESSSQDVYGKMKPNLIAPFTAYSSSLGKGGYSSFVTSSKLDITNIHEDRYTIGNEAPLQGPFAEKYVGGLQHRHIDLNYSSPTRGIDTEADRPEAWYLQPPAGLDVSHNLLDAGFDEWDNYLQFNKENFQLGKYGFDNRPSVANGLKYINYGNTIPSLSFTVDSSLTYEKGSPPAYITLFPHRGAGKMLVTPRNDSLAKEYTQETGKSLVIGPAGKLKKVREFSFFTPEIDLTNVDASVLAPTLKFYYLLVGKNPGTLRVQHATGKDATSTFTNLTTIWDGSSSESISGHQADAWRLATVDLSAYVGTKFYIRIVNHGHLDYGKRGYAAIDSMSLPIYSKNNDRLTLYDINYKKLVKQDPVTKLNYSLHRPRAPYYRDEYAKRPVNIRNIKQKIATELPGAVAKFNNETLMEEQKGHQKLPTIIGNYEHNYQVVQTSGRNVNNLWIRSGSKGSGGVEDSLSNPGAVFGLQDYKLVDRGKLPDGTVNKTVIAERFSAPGDVTTLSRGYLDRASETFSVYNALPWRNWGARRFLANIGTSSLLVRHSEKFGLRDGASNSSDALKYYGDTSDYFLTASYHKINRNTRYRPAKAGPKWEWVYASKGVDFGSQADGSVIVEVADHDDLSFDDANDGDQLTISFWIKRAQDNALNAAGSTNQETIIDKMSEYRVTIEPGDSASDPILKFYLGPWTSGYENYVWHEIKFDTTKNFKAKSGDWEHVVCTHKPVSSGGSWNIGAEYMSIYVNGELQTEFGVTNGSDGTYAGGSNGNGDVWLGAATLNTMKLNAVLDEVSLWNTALDSNEIAELYNGGKSTDLSTHSSNSSLVAWWKMGDVNDKCGSDYTDYVNSTYAEGSVTISGNSWPTAVEGEAASGIFEIDGTNDAGRMIAAGAQFGWFQLEDYNDVPVRFKFFNDLPEPVAATTTSTFTIPTTAVSDLISIQSLAWPANGSATKQYFILKDTNGNRVGIRFNKTINYGTTSTIVSADFTQQEIEFFGCNAVIDIGISGFGGFGTFTVNTVATMIKTAIDQANAGNYINITAGSPSPGSGDSNAVQTIVLTQAIGGGNGNTEFVVHVPSAIIGNWWSSLPSFTGGSDGNVTYTAAAGGNPKIITIFTQDLLGATEFAVQSRMYEAFVLAAANGWAVSATAPTESTNFLLGHEVISVNPIVLTQGAVGEAGNKAATYSGTEIGSPNPWFPSGLGTTGGVDAVLGQAVLDDDSFTITDASGNSLKIAFDSTQTTPNNSKYHILNTSPTPPVLTIATKDLSNPYLVAKEVRDAVENDVLYELNKLGVSNPRIALSTASPGQSAMTDSQTITLTQEVAGSTGNKSITTVGSHITAVDFTGGPDATAEGIIEDQKNSHDALIQGDSSVNYFVQGASSSLDYFHDANAQGNDAILKPVHDNWLVQHTIPQSDTQYNWIWRSLDQPQKPYNYYFASSSLKYNNRKPSAPWGHATASHEFRFLSASELGSRLVCLGDEGSECGQQYRQRGWVAHYSDNAYSGWGGNAPADTFVPDNFVGLNMNIVDRVSASVNTLGHFHESRPSTDSFPFGQTWWSPLTTSFAPKDRFRPAGIIPRLGTPSLLNTILIQRNGPYHYPSWKQIRTGEHPVARSHKKNNIISLTTEENVFGDTRPYDWHSISPGQDQRLLAHRRVKSDGLKIYNFTEPPVVSKFKPMAANADGGVAYVYTYTNNLIKFNNKALNTKLGIEQEINDYGRTTDNNIYNILATGPNARGIRYTETVWPRGQNTYLNETRKRSNYEEIPGLGATGKDRISHNTFWKTRHSLERPDRMRTEGTASNSMGWLLSRFGGPKMPDDTWFMDYHPTKPMPFCDAVSVAQGRLQNHVVSASDNMDFGGAVLPFCNPCIGSTFTDMALSAWPLDEGRYGGLMETDNARATATNLMTNYGGFYGPTYKQRWSIEEKSYQMAGRAGTANGQPYSTNPGPNDYRRTVWRGSYNLASGSTNSEFVSGTFGMKGELAEDPSMNFLVSWASAYWACGTASFLYPFDENNEQRKWTLYSTGNFDYTGMGGTSFHAISQSIHAEGELGNWDTTDAKDSDTPGWLPPPTFGTMFRGGYRRPYASPSFFRDPYNNFNVIALSSSFSGGPAGKESGSAETTYVKSVVVDGYIKGEHYKFSLAGGTGNSTKEFQANTLDFSGAMGYVKTAPYYRANRIAGKNPWYDSYDEYIDDVRSLGQDYGVLAEFNMSENMDEYLGFDYDFMQPNPGFLTLKGQELSSSLRVPAKSYHAGPEFAGQGQWTGPGRMNEQFLRRYCISDPMRYTKEKVAADRPGSPAPKKITLRFDAITKLLPYYGFYPATRTMQLATLFSRSIGPYLSSSMDNASINKKTYLGYHTSKEIWSAADGDTLQPEGENLRKFNHKGSAYVDNGAEFITASQHPTYEFLGSRSEPFGVPQAGDGVSAGFALRDGYHFSTKLFDLAHPSVPNNEGPRGWKQALLDVHKAGRMQAMLQPTFAPGIMFNTIKSGIAVDYPVYVNQKSPSVSVASAQALTDEETDAGIKLKNFTNGAILNDAPNYRVPFEAIYDLDKLIPHHVLSEDSGAPTEAWFTLPDGSITAKEPPKLYYTEPTWHMCGTDDAGNPKLGKQMAGSFYAQWEGFRRPMYERAAQNFFAEVPNFFLKRRGLTSFKSSPHGVLAMIPNKTYRMNVTLEIFDTYKPGIYDDGQPPAGSEFVMAEGPRRPLVPIMDRPTQYQPLPRRGSIFGPAVKKWIRNIPGVGNAHLDTEYDSTGGPTATGPIVFKSGSLKAADGALATTHSGSFTGSAGEIYDLEYHESDPCYMPWTPPYYYGKEIIQLAYTHAPDVGSDIWHSIITQDGAATIADMSPTIEQVVQQAKINPLTFKFNFLERPVTFRDDGTPILARHLTDVNNSPAYANRMTLASCLDLFELKTIRYTRPDAPIREAKIWEIRTKFECPVINLSGSSYVGSNRHRPDLNHQQQKSDSKGYFSDRTGRSVWMGYTDVTRPDSLITTDGRAPGIKITLSDAQYAPDESLMKKVGFAGAHNSNPDGETSKYIGQIAEKKKISEAIVAIPFLEYSIPGVTYQPFKRYGVNINFIKIHPDEYFAQWRNVTALVPRPAVHNIPLAGKDAPHLKLGLLAGNTQGLIGPGGFGINTTSISKLINNMKKYILPPELDFFHRGIGSVDDDKYSTTRNRYTDNTQDGIEPFIMYIQGFSRELSKKDLGDIWQNLLPDAGMRAEKDARIDSHKIQGKNSQFQLWGRLDDLHLTADQFDSLGYLPDQITNSNAETLKKIFGPPGGSGAGSGVKWLVFKVKERANLRMNQILDKNGEDNSWIVVDQVHGDTDIGESPALQGENKLKEKYGYNWPYDFFSLVEVAKMTVQYDY